MRAIVLVGGQGTRLRPLTYDVPKPMLPVAGVTMIERVIARLPAFGVDEVVLSMGYRPDAFTAAFPAGRAAGLGLVYAVEPEPMDTAGAIRFAADSAGIRETFLVLNGDVLTELDVGALIDFHRERRASATIALTPVEDPSAFGVVPTDADGRVTAFIEKPDRETAPTNLINAGTYVIEPEVLDLIPPGRAVSVERATFPELVAEGRLFALASDAYWLDTGTAAQFVRGCLDVLSRCRPPRPDVSEIAPGVWAARDVRPEGKVIGPALLDVGSQVGAGAVVEGSILGPGTRIGQDAAVTGSVLMADVVLDPGAAVVGSIVGPGSVIGAGARVQPVSIIGAQSAVPPGAELADARWPEPA